MAKKFPKAGRVLDREMIDRVAWAINGAWNRFGDVPFPLYQHEAEELAKAAIAAMGRSR